MIKIDKILRTKNITFSTSGKHATENHINVKCPFCGEGDPSFHLGISVINGAYHCWRNPKHSGYNIDYLISKILRISKKDARSLISENSDLSFAKEKVKDDTKIWSFMDTFVEPYKYKKPYSYLRKRGFDDVELVCNRYNLKYCNYGDWAGRLIIPIYDDTDSLVSFTARDVTGTSSIRYKTLESMYCKKDHRDLLFNSNMKATGKDLILVEGVMDAIKIEYISGSVNSWALMGLEMSFGKIDIIKKHAHLFSRIFLMLDTDQPKIRSVSMAKELTNYIQYPVSSLFLPENVKDAGEMTNYDLQTFLFRRRT